MLNNYGDFINGDVSTVDKAYIQLLSTVNTTTMYDEFFAARSGSTQTSSGITVTLASTANPVTSATPISTVTSVSVSATSSKPSTNPTINSGTSITDTKPSSSFEASASTFSPIKTNGSTLVARCGFLIQGHAAILMVGFTALLGLLQ
jgi:hypothetical protein